MLPSILTLDVGRVNAHIDKKWGFGPRFPVVKAGFPVGWESHQPRV